MRPHDYDFFSEVISKDKQVPGLWPPVDADLGLFTASFWV